MTPPAASALAGRDATPAIWKVRRHGRFVAYEASAQGSIEQAWHAGAGTGTLPISMSLWLAGSSSWVIIGSAGCTRVLRAFGLRAAHCSREQLYHASMGGEDVPEEYVVGLH